MTRPLEFPELLQSFFSKRLMAQRQASPHTIASYCDTFRLLLQFAHKTLGKAASQITLEDLNAPFIGAFLDNLEHDRGNEVRTRNLRMTVIRSFFRYAALESPQHSSLVQRVLAIPSKRHEAGLSASCRATKSTRFCRRPTGTPGGGGGTIRSCWLPFRLA